MTGSARGDSADSRWLGHDLLKQLLDDPADEDYRAAARKPPGSSPPSRSRVRLIGVLATFGILLGISAVKTAENSPRSQLEKAGLIAQADARQARLDSLEAQLRSLQSDVAGLQSEQARQSALQTRLTAQSTTLGIAAGTTPVQGPGVVITARNGPEGGGPQSTIADTDLQALVNGLWAAGAEAVAINGHRLTPFTAIRLAGQAITVDYRSLTPPYVVQAIGNPNTLPARFLQTGGGQLWLTLRASFGIGFSLRTTNSMRLPGQSSTSLHWAREATRR